MRFSALPGIRRSLYILEIELTAKYCDVKECSRTITICIVIGYDRSYMTT